MTGSFWGAFARLRKRLLASSCLSVRPSVGMLQLGSRQTDAHQIWYLSTSRKYVEIIHFSQKSYTNNGYFTLIPIQIFQWHLAQFFLQCKMFHTKVEENIKTYFIFNNFFIKSCRLLDNAKKNVQPDRPKMTIWRMRIACWIPKATNIHSRYVILIDFLLQQSLHVHVPMLRCTYPACRANPVLEHLSLCFLHPLLLPGYNLRTLVEIFLQSTVNNQVSFVCFFFATAPSGSGPPHSRGF
jgi:hypothetical protein